MNGDFPPDKRKGLILLVGICILMILGIVFLFFNASRARAGSEFQVQVILGLVLIFPMVYLLLRVYSLFTMNYNLGRDGLVLKWGWRREDIPLNSIEWVRPANEMGFQIPKPWLILPGSLLGMRRVESLGIVEYVATQTENLVLVAVEHKIFIISPQDPKAFMSTYAVINELGSLDPIEARSVRPKALFLSIWNDQIARWMTIAGILAVVVLLTLTTKKAEDTSLISWFGGDGAPAERLYLLPILSGLIWAGDLVTGIFIYRRSTEYRLAAYFLWAASILTSVLFIISLALLK
jgi:hypothetical protein